MHSSAARCHCREDDGGDALTTQEVGSEWWAPGKVMSSFALQIGQAVGTFLCLVPRAEGGSRLR
jgi:hypothetical protein